MCRACPSVHRQSLLGPSCRNRQYVFCAFHVDGYHVFGLSLPKYRRTRVEVVDTVFKAKEVIFLVAVGQLAINIFRHVVEGQHPGYHVFLEAISRQLLVHNLLDGLNESIIMLLLLLQCLNPVQEKNLKVIVPSGLVALTDGDPVVDEGGEHNTGMMSQNVR